MQASACECMKMYPSVISCSYILYIYTAIFNVVPQWSSPWIWRSHPKKQLWLSRITEESNPRSDAGQCFYTTQLGRFWLTDLFTTQAQCQWTYDKIYIYIYILLQDSWGWHIGGLPPEVRSTYSTWIIYVCLPFVLNWFPWLQKWFGMDSSRFVPSARILCHTSSIAGCVDHCHVGWRNIFCFSHHMWFAHHSKTQTPQIAWNPLTSFKVLVRLLGGFVDSCDWSELVLHSLMLGI